MTVPASTGWFTHEGSGNEPKIQNYSEPCQTSKMKLFAKIANGWKLLTIFVKAPS